MKVTMTLLSYTDRNTTYISDINLDLVVIKLENSTRDIFWWFKENQPWYLPTCSDKWSSSFRKS